MSNKRFLVLAIAIIVAVLGPSGMMMILNSINPVAFDVMLSSFHFWLTGAQIKYTNTSTTPTYSCTGDTCTVNIETLSWSTTIILLSGLPAFFYVLIVTSTWATTIYAHQGVTPVSIEQMRSRLVGLNDEKIPFEIIVDKKNPNKIVARWNIIDSKWLQIFSANRLTIYYELRMRLVDRGSKGKYVKAQDYLRKMEYSIGTDVLNPLQIHLHYNFNLNKGIIPYHYDKRLLYGLIYNDDQFKIDYAYNFRFVNIEIKNPIIKVITESGRDFRPTVFLLR